MLQFLKLNFRWVAGGFLLTYFSSFGQTFFIAGSIAEWRAAFDLSHGDFGQLFMFATLASALCLPFLGRLVDLMPQHLLILLVMPVLAAATLIVAYASSILILTFGVFLLRLFGQGMMTHIALTATGRWFSAQRGRAVSLVALGHQGGVATLPTAFSSVASGYGYQAGWVTSAACVLLVGLPLAYLAYRKPRTPLLQAADSASMGPAVRSWTRREVLGDPVFWVLLTGVLAPPFIGTTIFYHQDYLTELRGWPPHYYALSLSIVAITTVVFALVSGALIDRFRASAVLPFFLLPMAASCFGLATDGPAEILFLVMVLLGISYGFSSTLFGSIWPEIYGVDNLGAIRSVTVSAMVFASAAGPGITGTLIDSGIALPTQMVWFGLYCIAAAVALRLVAVQINRSSKHAAT